MSEGHTGFVKRHIMHFMVCLAAVAMCSPVAHALQIITPTEGSNTFVRISAKELTRIAVDGGKVRSVLYSEGELQIEKDDDRGQVFVRPAMLDKPINVRVITSSNRTYSLILQAADVPQEDVIIQDGDQSAAARPVTAPRATGWQSGIRSLVLAMASGEKLQAVQVEPRNREIVLWEGVKFILETVYRDRVLTGEKYRLHNLSSSRIRMTEQEFYRKGVVAVGIESLALEPGQNTVVYVVRTN
jgi:conjugal transfer pilus assembly protein TraK